MSWSSAASRNGLIILAISLCLALSACTGFRPVYSEANTGPQRYAFVYSDPASRLDQIIYAELRLRLGPQSKSPDAYRVGVSTSAGARGLFRTPLNKPAGQLEMVVSTGITVVSPEGEILFSGVRRVSAFYANTGQVLGDIEAQREAADRGAKALAEVVRLTVLAVIETGTAPPPEL